MKKILLALFFFIHFFAVAQYNNVVPLYTLQQKANQFINSCMVFSPNGKILLYGSFDGLLNMYDCEKGTQMPSVSAHNKPIASITYSTDGRYVATGDDDGIIKIWNTSTWKEFLSINAHNKTVTFVTFSPDGEYLLSGGKDNYFKIWEVKTGSNTKTFDKIAGTITDLKFSPDGKYVLCASGKALLANNAFEGVKFFDALTGGEVKRLELPEMQNFTINMEESIIAMTNKKIQFSVWDAKLGQKKDEISGHVLKINALTFSPGGKYLVTASDDKSIKIWDLTTKTAIATLGEHKGEVTGAVISPLGNYLATSSLDNTIKIWDLSKIKLPKETIYAGLKNTDITDAEREIINNAQSSLIFADGKAIVPKEAQKSLDAVATLLTKNKAYSLIIIGHTNNTQDAQTSFKLSSDRAESVKKYLVSKKAPAAKITTQAFGATKPLISNFTEQGKRVNNRIELIIKKK